MIDLDKTFVYDAVTHAYNTDPSNYRNERHAKGITDMLYGAGNTILPSGSKISRDGYIRDWKIEETANILFLESQTDMATFQPTPLYAFHDGLVANEKAERAKRQWPNRFKVYGTIDPLRDNALKELEKQVESFDPLGLKLYPSHWSEDSHEGWSMSDPRVAYPVFEKALDLGIEFVDIHKAIPFGPVPRHPYHPGDVDEAADSFPEITFSIVHGGYAFAEETAWQLARFPNVYVNLEGLGGILVRNQTRFAELFGTLISVAGKTALEKMFWSSAAMQLHPQPQLEAFRDFEFPDHIRKGASRNGELPKLTDEYKRKILGENYCDLIGLDIEEAKSSTDGDEFSQIRKERGLADPYSTTEAAEEVY